MPIVPPQPTCDDVKACVRCGDTKPLDEYYVDKRSNRPFARCKTCHNAQSQAWYHATKLARGPRVAPVEKVCVSCKQLLPIDAFSKRSRGENGTRSDCKACRRAAKAVYRAAHLDAVRTSARAYYAAHTEACLTRIKRVVIANPTKYQAIHTDWKRRNKAAVNASTHKRRARLTGHRGWWTARDWERIKARQGWCCLMCGLQEMTDGITLCADHVVPLDKGGWNIAANIQGLCRGCNSTKHTRVLDLRPAFYS